jgi:hypothetical protein
MVMMSKQADIISFRPGEYAGEFAKRAPDGQMSIVAKTLAAQTFAMLRAELAQLAGTFGAAEMQIIVAALYDAPNDPAQIAHTVTQAVARGAMVRDIASRYNVDTAELISKLQRLHPGAQFAIKDAVVQFRRLPMNEAWGLNEYPSLATLRRLGLLATEGRVAWGFCSVGLASFSVSEFVLHRDPSSLGLRDSSHTIDELARAIVGYTRAMLGGEVDPANDDAGFALAYSIAVKTGWRYFRIDEREDGEACVVQISREALLDDIEDGSGQGLVLEGINAPEAAHIASPERTLSEKNTQVPSRKHRGKRGK